MVYSSITMGKGRRAEKSQGRVADMLKVYIEENSFTHPRPIEVSDEAPLLRLLPALVQELGLPQTDLSGKPLVYFLRAAGRALPEHASLRMLGIRSEESLRLESYAVTPPMVPAGGKQPVVATAHSSEFYSDQTLADVSSFMAMNAASSLNATYERPQQPVTPGYAPSPGSGSGRRKSWTRRAVVIGGSAVLACAGVGLGYAAYQSLMSTRSVSIPPVARNTVQPSPTPPPTKPANTLPTHANMLLNFTQHKQAVHTVAWSPDGTQLASGASDRLLLIWDTQGQVNRKMTQVAAVHAVTWSPDGHQMAVAAANQVVFLNALTGGVEARSTHTHQGNVMTLAWSKQQPQMLVSGGQDKLAVVWNTQTFKPQVFFRKHGNPILSATWADDGQTVGTCSTGGVTRVWNGHNGQELHGFFMDGQAETTALAFEPTGTSLVVGGTDGVVRLWASGLTCQVEGQGNMQGQCMDQSQHLNAHTQAIRALAWSPDGRLLASAGDDGLLLIWNPAQSQKPLVSVQHQAAVEALSWSPDGKKVATASGNIVTLWGLN